MDKIQQLATEMVANLTAAGALFKELADNGTEMENAMKDGDMLGWFSRLRRAANISRQISDKMLQTAEAIEDATS